MTEPDLRENLSQYFNGNTGKDDSALVGGALRSGGYYGCGFRRRFRRMRGGLTSGGYGRYKRRRAIGRGGSRVRVKGYYRRGARVRGYTRRRR